MTMSPQNSLNVNPSPAQASPTSTAAEVLGAPVTQTASPAEVPKTQAQEQISPKLQILAQREKAAVERERSAKTYEAKVKAREDAIAAREARDAEMEALKAANPIKWLEAQGLSYQALTQIALNDGQVPAELQVKQLEEKFESKFKAQEEERRLAAESAKVNEAKQNEKTITTFKGEIGAYIKDNSSRYELMAFENPEDSGQDLVFDVIDEHYDRTLKAAVEAAQESDPDADISDLRGEVMTIKDAADKIELHLEQKYQKARDLPKVAGFLAPKQVKQSDKPKQAPQSPQTKTLTNQMSATQSATPRKHPITDDERVAKAIAYARSLRAA